MLPTKRATEIMQNGLFRCEMTSFLTPSERCTITFRKTCFPAISTVLAGLAKLAAISPNSEDKMSEF